jgi:pimeloyl-ACP methyl ester carboxylesterase
MLSAFGLIHSTASADTEEKKQSRQQGIKLINEYGAFSFLKNTIPNLYSANFKKNHPEIIDEVINQSRSFSKDALIQYYSAMMNRTDKSKVLEESSVPVLFVIGKEDVAAPLDIVIHQVHLPKISHIHILDNVAHTSMLEAPVELVKIIEEFILHEH